MPLPSENVSCLLFIQLTKTLSRSWNDIVFLWINTKLAGVWAFFQEKKKCHNMKLLLNGIHLKGHIFITGGQKTDLKVRTLLNITAFTKGTLLIAFYPDRKARTTLHTRKKTLRFEERSEKGSGPGCIKILKITGDFLQLFSAFREYVFKALWFFQCSFVQFIPIYC